MSFDTPSVDGRVCWQPPALRSSHAIGPWLPAILLIACVLPWLLSACGGGGSSGTGYADRPPSDRVAYTAWQEWTKFGRSTVVYGGHAGGYVNRAGVTERSEPLTSKIGDYWGSCGHPNWDGRTSKPWSGAFVAWTMAHSGIPASEFPRDARHGGYLAALYDRQQRGGRVPFALHAPNEYSPKPGDLVCTGSSGPTWRNADSRTARRRIDSAASHCDIVTDVRGGYVQAIGGNVKNSVTMSLFPVDSRGRLVPFAGKTWFMVVEKRV
ncbi:MAG: DUF2272 domain-containing protein [Reyranella sp.]|nr:DUF2272 domain-containing protein [Reyranella sp.]MBL6650234.1 DUF2272 domain-containing protein [Reyranella sp.]